MLKGVFGRRKKPITQAGIIDKTNLQTLEVITDGSDIEVSIHDKPFIDIVFQTYENGPQLNTRHDGANATIEALGGDEGSWFAPFNQPSRRLHIRVPLRIADTWNIRTGSGDVTIPKMRATTFHGITGSGDWVLKGIQVTELRVKASSGDMVLDDLTADTINVSVTSGDAELSRVRGNTGSETSQSEEFTNQNRYSESCTVHVTSGDVALVDLQTNDIQLGCTSGDINAENIVAKQAMLKATSGDIRYSFIGDGSVKGRATSGDLSVVCKTQRPNANIDIQTGTGDIDTNISSSTQRFTPNQLEAVLGNGDHRIQLETTSGDVELWCR